MTLALGGRAAYHRCIVTLALAASAGAVAAGLLATTVRASPHTARLRRRRWMLVVLAWALGLVGFAVLVSGALVAGAAVLALALVAFVCSIVLVRPRRPPDDPDDGGGGGGGGPVHSPGGSPGGDGLEWDWERFADDLEAHIQAQAPRAR